MVRMIRRSTLVTSGRVEDAAIKTVDIENLAVTRAKVATKAISTDKMGTEVLRVLRYSFLGTVGIVGPKGAWHTFPGMSTGTLVWGRPEGGSVDIEAYAQASLYVTSGALRLNMNIAGTWPSYLQETAGPTSAEARAWSWRKKVRAGSLAVKALAYADGTLCTNYHRSLQVYELKRRF